MLLPRRIVGAGAPQEHLDLPFTYEAMAEAGSMLGTASVIVVDDSQPLVLALRLAEFAASRAASATALPRAPTGR